MSDDAIPDSLSHKIKIYPGWQCRRWEHLAENEENSSYPGAKATSFAINSLQRSYRRNSSRWCWCGHISLNWSVPAAERNHYGLWYSVYLDIRKVVTMAASEERIKVGSTPVYDMNLIYSRVNGFLAFKDISMDDIQWRWHQCVFRNGIIRPLRFYSICFILPWNIVSVYTFHLFYSSVRYCFSTIYLTIVVRITVLFPCQR